MCSDSHRRRSVTIDDLRDFVKFTGKHLCQSLFFNKVAGLRPQACNFIKKETLAQVLSCEICESLKNNFFYRTPLVAASVISRPSSHRKAYVYEHCVFIFLWYEINY